MGDTFAFAKGGATYTVLKRSKNDVLSVLSDTGIVGRINAAAFTVEAKTKVLPTP